MRRSTRWRSLASDVEELASDSGFVSFIGAPEPDDGEDLAQTEAGRRTLTWLIGKALVDSELAVQDLPVDDQTLDRAADDLRGGDVPDEVDVIVDDAPEMDDDAFDEAAESLAAYVTLDEWLRTIEPTDPELQDRIRTEHPEVADFVCGSASRSTRRTPVRCVTSSRREPPSTRSRTMYRPCHAPHPAASA